MKNLKSFLLLTVLFFTLFTLQAQNTKLHVEGSFATVITTTTTNLTLDESHQVVLVDAPEGQGLTITLPSAVDIAGRKYTIKKIGDGTVSITTQSGQQIDGILTSPIFLTGKPYLTLVSDGNNWWVIGEDS